MEKKKGKTAAPRRSRRAAAPIAVGVMGLGYVGLPLSIAFARAGCRVVGYDPDERRVAQVNAGRSYMRHIADDAVASIGGAGGCATSDPSKLSETGAILICVPTPLTRHRDPDMRFVESAVATAAGVLRAGQLVCLESTTYPGTTRELVVPGLEKSGLAAGVDFHVAYSPEREDPGVRGHSAGEIPKVVGGLTERCLERARELYGLVAPQTVAVSSLEVAEASKLMENIFRCVNIALVNELKTVFARMGIDVWEVVAAAGTKPFGFMPFYPGPGLGGHCIPVDPFYLAWKAREYETIPRFIELAGEINVSMPEYVVARTVEELNRDMKSLGGSRILLLGIAYKRDVDDTRESPSVRLMQLFRRQGAKVDYHDPHVPEFAGDDAHEIPPMRQAPLTARSLRRYDAVVVATDHSDVDYGLLGRAAALIIDTRNVMDGREGVRARVAKA